MRLGCEAVAADLNLNSRGVTGKIELRDRLARLGHDDRSAPDEPALVFELIYPGTCGHGDDRYWHRYGASWQIVIRHTQRLPKGPHEVMDDCVFRYVLLGADAASESGKPSL